MDNVQFFRLSSDSGKFRSAWAITSLPSGRLLVCYNTDLDKGTFHPGPHIRPAQAQGGEWPKGKLFMGRGSFTWAKNDAGNS